MVPPPKEGFWVPLEEFRALAESGRRNETALHALYVDLTAGLTDTVALRWAKEEIDRKDTSVDLAPWLATLLSRAVAFGRRTR